MIDAGYEASVKVGYPVINADGLVGRVIETGRSSSRVLLSNDLNSHIPVVIGAKEIRAVLAGDGGAEPRLLFLPSDAKIAAGEDVSTSGTGGLFPRGLRIGTVSGTLNAPRVKLRARLDELEYLSVLFYENPSLELMGEPVATSRILSPRENELRAGGPSGAQQTGTRQSGTQQPGARPAGPQ